MLQEDVTGILYCDTAGSSANFPHRDINGTCLAKSNSLSHSVNPLNLLRKDNISKIFNILSRWNRRFQRRIFKVPRIFSFFPKFTQISLKSFRLNSKFTSFSAIDSKEIPRRRKLPQSPLSRRHHMAPCAFFHSPTTVFTQTSPPSWPDRRSPQDPSTFYPAPPPPPPL